MTDHVTVQVFFSSQATLIFVLKTPQLLYLWLTSSFIAVIFSLHRHVKAYIQMVGCLAAVTLLVHVS